MADGELAADPALDPFDAPPVLTMKEGWRRFCADRSTERPAPLDGRKRLGAAERMAYDHERISYHPAFGPIRTPDLDRLVAEIGSTLETNRLSGSPGAWPGAVIDALGTLGKTTILAELGREYERRLRRLVAPGLCNRIDEFVPVVYISVDSAATVKGIDRSIADFYGLPISPRSTRDELTKAFTRAAIGCGTSLFIVDDLQNLEPRRRDHRDVSGHFKHLANVLPATFVFAGIDVEEGGLLDEDHGPGRRYLSQTRGRVSVHHLKHYEIDSDEGVQRWRSLVASFAKHLIVPGADALATRHWRYLHLRTAGSIGSLSHLLRRGANLAVKRGDPRLGPRLLNEIRLDSAAEDHYRRSGHRGASKRR